MRRHQKGFMTHIRTVLAVSALLASATLAQAAAQLPLMQAARRGDVQTVRTLIKQGSDVNAVEADGSTALHHAANRGDSAVVEALLAGGARATVATRYGITPLALAATSGNVQVIEALIKAGADANGVGAGGETMLMTAARTGNAAALKALLTAGAKVDARETRRGQTALMWAAAAGNVDGMKVLIESGADVKAKSNEVDFKLTSRRGEGQTGGPTGGFSQAAQIQFTPLAFAVRGGSIGAVTLLLDSGASANEKLPDGLNMVILAIINAHWELAGLLVDRGADVNAAEAGWTALHQVARSRSLTVGHVPHPTQTGQMSSLDLAKKLLAKGANVNARMTKDGMKADGYRTDLNRIGATAYLLAAKGVDHELMRLLLAAGADPLLTNDHGMRPLMVAAGVALHATGEDTGTHEDALEAVKMAYEADKDVNYVDKRGHTAILGAARRGSLTVARFLVEHGADLSVTMKRENFVGQAYGTKGLSWSPLTIALGYGKDGEPLFLGSERHFEVAGYLYNEMKKRGVSFEHEHAESLAFIRAQVGEAPAVASADPAVR